MTARLVQIRRHPVKGIGSELLETVRAEVGHPLPLDRAWALLQQGQTDTGDWQPRRNFLQCAAGPGLMAVSAKAGRDTITLHHPDRPDLTFDPQTEGARLAEWVQPIWPRDRPAPAQLVKAPDIGMADSNFASVSLMTHSSLRALSERIGQPLDPRRFRGNLWLERTGPWEEFEWVGRRVAVGAAEFEVVERIERCRATEANPETGQRDANVLRALEDGWGHRDFGISARVIRGGAIALGDKAVLL